MQFYLSFLPYVCTITFRSAIVQIQSVYVLWLHICQGVEVVPTPDQNLTDFTKCLQLVIDRIQCSNTKVETDVFMLKLIYNNFP